MCVPGMTESTGNVKQSNTGACRGDSGQRHTCRRQVAAGWVQLQHNTADIEGSGQKTGREERRREIVRRGEGGVNSVFCG